MDDRHIYKGKRIDNGEWVEGYYAVKGIKTDCEKHFICVSTFDANTSGYPFYFTDIEVDPETVSEYIGLNDKNGNKIFENDIVGIYSKYRQEYDYAVVEYGKFNCSCCNGVYGWQFIGEDIRSYELYEVKGNIFDNPELLNQ